MAGGDSSAVLVWDHIPVMSTPYLVVGFHGWSNAGSVSSDTLEYLVDTLEPRDCARLSSEPFINYSLDRPIAHIEDGIIHDVEPFFTQVMCWHNAEGDHDLILFLGKEPHFNWLAFARAVLELMETLNAKKLFTIGGVQDTVSHTAPVLVSAVGSSPAVVADVIALDPGIRPAEYYGPISIHSCLIKACLDRGLDAVSLWGHVPAYLQKSPRLVATMIGILNREFGMDCPLDELKRKAIELDRKIHEALAKDPNLKRFVETIEREGAIQPAVTGDDKVIRLNDFLHRGPHLDPKP